MLQLVVEIGNTQPSWHLTTSEPERSDRIQLVPAFKDRTKEWRFDNERTITSVEL